MRNSSGLVCMLRCVGRSLFRTGGTPVRLTFMRLFSTLVLMPFCLALWLMHEAGFALDNLFFRGYKKVKVRQPVFVVGPPRCGTTFLHRLLARGNDQFSALTLGEMIFAPSVTERVIFSLPFRIDGLLGHPAGRVLGALEKRMFKGFNELHHVSFREPEEDYVLLAYRFANQILLAMFPYPDLLGHLWRFDSETPLEQRRKILDFYRACVQRHLYYHGEDKIFLSKNPYFTPMIRSVGEVFPDARFVLVARHPYESLPSMLLFWKMLYGFFGSDPDHYLAREFVVDFMRDFYCYARECLDEMPEGRGMTVDFGELIAGPESVLSDLMRRLDLAFKQDHYQAVRGEKKETGKHRSDRRAGVEDFGYSTEEIDARFKQVYALYGFRSGSEVTR